MSIVHVVVPDGIDDPARPSGGNTYDRHICRELGPLGWSVRQHPVPGFWSRPEPASFCALDRVLQHLSDGAVVLLDGLIASTAPDVLVPQAKRLRIVVLVHLPLGLRTDDPVIRQREHSVLSAAAAVVTTSRWARRELLALYTLAERRVYVAEPGATTAAPAPGSASGGGLLCVAAVTRDKGQDLLLDALRSITELSWHCTCVGSLDREPAFADTLRRQVLDAGLTERVSLPGARTGVALHREYAAADVVVLMSRVETYGMVITEALARGLPVIAADVGGVREAMGHGTTGTPPGLLVPPHGPAGLAAALRAWLTDPELRARLRRTASERRDVLPRWSATASTIADALIMTTHDPRQPDLVSPPRAG